MGYLIALAASIGFLLSLVVHVSALLRIDSVALYPSVWLLHFGIFMVYIPFVLDTRKTLGARPSMAQLKSLLPPPIIAAGIAMLGYMLINFAFFLMATEGSSPAIRDGQYILQCHGHFVRELTANEYKAFLVNEVRGFSGHWLFFYFVPFAYFMFRKDKQKV